MGPPVHAGGLAGPGYLLTASGYRLANRDLVTHTARALTKTRRLNPAGFSCKECQRRSSLLTFILRGSDVPSGTVKSFDAAKGYGFIMPDGGGEDVYVHASVVEKAGLKELHFRAKVTFDLVLNHHGKTVADNLRMK